VPSKFATTSEPPSGMELAQVVASDLRPRDPTCVRPEASLAFGLRLAAGIRHCADRSSALRVTAEIVSRELAMSVSVWRTTDDGSCLVLVSDHRLSSGRHRKLAHMATTWPVVPDRAGAFTQLRDAFRSVTGASNPSLVDLDYGVMLLADRCVEIEGSRHELRSLLSTLPDTNLASVEVEQEASAPELSQLERLRIGELTPREREVLALLMDGADTRSMAERLAISAKTVKTHVQNILAKLGVTSRLEAAALARRHGFALRTVS
jgi:DNA-binding CsgD family transcriptional regulator